MSTAQKPKILFYYPDYGATGGIGRYIMQVCRQLQQADRFEPIIACSENTLFYNQMREAGFRVHGLQTPSWASGKLHNYFIKPVVRVVDFGRYAALMKIVRQ
jgi:hypothetical protein